MRRGFADAVLRSGAYRIRFRRTEGGAPSTRRWVADGDIRVAAFRTLTKMLQQRRGLPGDSLLIPVSTSCTSLRFHFTFSNAEGRPEARLSPRRRRASSFLRRGRKWDLGRDAEGEFA